MANPFEDESAGYRVLVNGEGQYSLWPDWLDVPAGWTSSGREGKRADCLRWIDANWTDMRPKSLIAAMDEAE